MIETAEQYTERLLSLVGDGHPLEILAMTPSRIGCAIASRSDADLRWTPEPRRWCVAAIVAHLADLEVVAGYRLRMILANPGTAIQAFDQNQWASAFDYQARNAFSSLEAFAALRTTTLRLLDGLDERRLEHYGMHQERGRETIRHLIRLYAGHDVNHTQQIERLLDAVDAHRRSTRPPFQPRAVKPTVDPDLLGQLDIRVGTITTIAEIPGATRLSALTVDFGDHQRTIVAGIKEERAQPHLLAGHQALFVVNLPVRTIHGQVSQGMLVDVGFADGIRPALAQPEWPVPNGSRAG